MLTEFTIKNYRGISDLEFPSFGRVNLFAGDNGVGKTSVLEAVHVFTSRYNIDLLRNRNVQRTGILRLNPLEGLGGDGMGFEGIEDETECAVDYRYEGMSGNPLTSTQTNLFIRGLAEPQLSVLLGRLVADYYDDRYEPIQAFSEIRDFGNGQYQTNPSGFPIEIPPTPPRIIITAAGMDIGVGSIEGFSRVVAQGTKKEFVDRFGIINPNVTDLEIVNQNNTSTLYATMRSGQVLPMEALGDGFRRVFHLFLGFFTVKDGLILVDEIENGIHYKVLPELWKSIFAISHELNVQVFATTHSRECVFAALEAANTAVGQTAMMEGNSDDEPNLDELTLYRLYKRGDKIGAVHLTQENLEGAFDMGLAIR